MKSPGCSCRSMGLACRLPAMSADQAFYVWSCTTGYEGRARAAVEVYGLARASSDARRAGAACHAGRAARAPVAPVASVVARAASDLVAGAAGPIGCRGCEDAIRPVRAGRQAPHAGTPSEPALAATGPSSAPAPVLVVAATAATR